MAGFGADPGEFAAVAGSVRGLADPIRDEHGKRVGQPRVGSADFGAAHGQFFSGYQQAMAKLSRCVHSMAGAMDDFAGKLERTGSGYDWSDADAAESVRGSGATHG